MKYLLLWMLVVLPVMAGEPTLVYLVRHAEKVDDSRDADLSERGLKRAAELAAFFEKIEVNQLYASQFQRTQKTLQPLADAKGLKLAIISAGEPEQLIDSVRGHAGKTIVIAGHSNTLPDLIARLGAGEVTIADDAYRNLFLVILNEDGAVLQNFQLP